MSSFVGSPRPALTSARLSTTTTTLHSRPSCQPARRFQSNHIYHYRTSGGIDLNCPDIEDPSMTSRKMFFAHLTVASPPQVRPLILRLRSSFATSVFVWFEPPIALSSLPAELGVSLLFTTVETCCAPCGLSFGGCSVTFECPPEPLGALQSAPHVRLVREWLRERSVSSYVVRVIGTWSRRGCRPSAPKHTRLVVTRRSHADDVRM